MNNHSLLAVVQVPLLQGVNVQLPCIHLIRGMRAFARFPFDTIGPPTTIQIGKYAIGNGGGNPQCDQAILLSNVFPNYVELYGYNTSEYVAMYNGSPATTVFLEVLVYINRGKLKFAHNEMDARGGVGV